MSVKIFVLDMVIECCFVVLFVGNIVYLCSEIVLCDYIKKVLFMVDEVLKEVGVML